MSKIYDYSFSTYQEDTERRKDLPGDLNIFETQSTLAVQSGIGGPIAGLGFGLPLTRRYAEYFGGSFNVVSIYGHGCDVFLKLKNIGDHLSGVSL
jgi:hypothetical protein